ncbi:MAG: Nif3-like dinuclear metal center hexameric protein [Cyanobacteria bacterium NC_groundwater_1444_Ag_S-0.65um_54_12]|nr:Nif3-like dinuclear metal center hexameric protein [Cyanobacteria bacterium NC_groundwater_1444_Ag_S-0.65um_54_12]
MAYSPMDKYAIATLLETLAPVSLAADWDNCGLQVGDLAGELKGILVALNASLAACQRAIDLQCNLLVTHHPLFFKPLRQLLTTGGPGRIASRLLANDIALYTAHTNLDVVACNRRLADLLGWDFEQVLAPEANGMGLCGDLPEPLTISAIANRIRQALAPNGIRLVGASQKLVKRVGICAGSGSDLLAATERQQVDLFITGEIRYHVALEARDRQIAILEIGHQTSEEPVVDFLVGYLRKRLPATLLIEGFHEAEPFEVLL